MLNPDFPGIAGIIVPIAMGAAKRAPFSHEIYEIQADRSREFPPHYSANC